MKAQLLAYNQRQSKEDKKASLFLIAAAHLETLSKQYIIIDSACQDSQS